MLLIDEVDRADEAFEAYLLELLSDFQMSIPELGTVRATTIPLVVVTSNGTRELSDALRRRCLYQYLDYPSYEKELAIVELRAPAAAGALAQQVVQFVQAVRKMDLVEEARRRGDARLDGRAVAPRRDHARRGRRASASSTRWPR